MVFVSLFVVVLSIGLPVHNTFAQVEQYREKPEFSINGRNDRPVTIPFELVNNLIIIEVSLNGSVPLKLILDSGVTNTLITSLPNNEEIYLHSTRTVSLSGLGEGEPIEAFYSEKNQINIGKVVGTNVEIFFLKEDIFRLSSFMGTYVHGLIGYDIFANFAVEINYLSKEILLYDPKEFKEKFEKLPRHWKWHKFPITVEDDKPYVEMRFKHEPGINYSTLKLLIDTGSSNAFSLYELTHNNITIPESNISTLIGVGLSGKINGYMGRVKKMRLGEFVFDEPVVAYPDSHAIRRVFFLGERNGSVGGEVLRRFKIIFHYQEGYILVRANKDFGDRFHYNLSGIEVNTPIPNIPLYVVSEVRENSPADKEGIMKGDVIKYINGEPAARFDLNEIIAYLQKNQGSRVQLEVQRDTLFKRFRLKLDNELVVDD